VLHRSNSRAGPSRRMVAQSRAQSEQKRRSNRLTEIKAIFR
jgi:hypothetical protein